LVYLVGLKLDGYLDMPWYVIMAPEWCFNLLCALFGAFSIAMWTNRYESNVFFVDILSTRELKAVVIRTFPVIMWRKTRPILLSTIICSVLFPLFLMARMQHYNPVAKWSWWAVYSPLLYISLIKIATNVTDVDM
jgi:hypothetical protein